MLPLQLMEAFVEEYFDQNPISQVSWLSYRLLSYLAVVSVGHPQNCPPFKMTSVPLHLHLGGPDHHQEQESREADWPCRCEKKIKCCDLARFSVCCSRRHSCMLAVSSRRWCPRVCVCVRARACFTNRESKEAHHCPAEGQGHDLCWRTISVQLSQPGHADTQVSCCWWSLIYYYINNSFVQGYKSLVCSYIQGHLSIIFLLF